jgi:hypothetical protein
MRIFLSLLVVAATLLLSIHPLTALAADVKFTPATSSAPISIDAQVPVNKIGALLLADGVCIMTGTTIVVMGKAGPSAPHQAQVQGHIVNNQLTTNGKVGQINGKAYFDHGPSLKTLGEPKEERVVLHNGHIYNGHIVSVDDHVISLQQAQGGENVRVPLQDVRAIHSPHVYNYTVNIKADNVMSQTDSFTAHATRINFQPTTNTHVASIKNSNSLRHPTVKQVVIGTAVVLGVATAIAVPIAVGVAAHNHHAHQIAQQNSNRIAQALLIRRIQATQPIVQTPAPIRVLPTTISRVVPVRTPITNTRVPGAVSNVGS